MKERHSHDFLERITKAVHDSNLVKMTLSKYRGTEKGLKSIYVRPIILHKKPFISILYRYDTRDITKNYKETAFLTEIANHISGTFKHIYLFTKLADYSLRYNKKGEVQFGESKPSYPAAGNLQHNIDKNFIIKPQSSILHGLGITNTKGEIKPKKYDKYKQINKFLEIVSVAFNKTELNKKSTIKIVDCGSGKSDLTFSLHYYFSSVLNIDTNTTGIEIRKDLIEASESNAHKLNLANITFFEGNIDDYKKTDSDIVIALHACNTATDDAIALGIQSEAELIVVAPCCHKYLRPKMKGYNELTPILSQGILAQRQSDIITDGLRYLTLEYLGYKTQVFEFISLEHTSKNIMIVARKALDSKKAQKRKEIQLIKHKFGITDYYLDKKLNIF